MNRIKSVQEIQEIELNIMKCIHSFCVKNKLKYSLCFGTLLGAYRHRGFIPWDNDMDIMMARPYFEIFIKSLENHEISEILDYVYYTNDDKYHYQCIRVFDKRTKVDIPYLVEQPNKMGVWVDVFPVDGIGKLNVKNIIINIRMRIIKMILRMRLYKRNDAFFIKRIVCKIAFIFNDNDNVLEKKLDYLARKNKYNDCCYVGTVKEHDFVLKRKIKRLDLENIRLVDFEDTQFFIQNNAEKQLSDVYGKWQILPPEDKRNTHEIIASWR